MVEIRLAELTLDEEALTGLLAEAKTVLGALRGGEAFVDDSGDLSGSLPSAVQEGRVWVALEGGIVVGAAMVWIDGSKGWLGAWVQRSSRQSGRGRSLAATALRWLDQHGVASIDAYALPGDRATKQLFESLGFKARLLVMRRSD
jgi:GNAT superfamily N-acetyltransferase